MDEKIKLWVQDSADTDRNDPDLPERIPFVIIVTPKTSIEEVKVGGCLAARHRRTSPTP